MMLKTVTTLNLRGKICFRRKSRRVGLSPNKKAVAAQVQALKGNDGHKAGRGAVKAMWPHAEEF